MKIRLGLAALYLRMMRDRAVVKGSRDLRTTHYLTDLERIEP
jgi:hypothetical protein